MMAVDGSTAMVDSTFEMFNRKGRKIVHCEGWLVDDIGSDGEPILVGTVTVR